MCKAMEDWAEECRNEGRASLLELISRMAAGGDAEFIVRLSEKEVMEAMTKKYEMEEILEVKVLVLKMVRVAQQHHLP